MIYLDNSATTFPKPMEVRERVAQSFKVYGANPGRSGYAMSMNTSNEVYSCRKEIANFFGINGAENCVFTLNCTHALNIVIKGNLKPGDHVIVSDMEHNAVMRPLDAMKQKGVQYTIAPTFEMDNDRTVDSFRASMRENTKLVICTGASNVWGIRLPVERICALAHLYGAQMCVDAAQTAGVVPINMGASEIDFLCAAGHKGLYGPMGTGILVLGEGRSLETLTEGGTGTNSQSLLQPEEPPERYESGTQNIPGIIGIKAGISFVNRKGIDNIYKEEMVKIQYFYDRLESIPFVTLYTGRPVMGYYVPVLSFNIDGMASEEVGEYLRRYDIATRCGLHCAPCAHQKFGTDRGTVRVSPSVFTQKKELDMVIRKLSAIKMR